MKTPSRVVIVGGTHGNEWTGIQVVKHYQEDLRKKFPTLNLEFILANPLAHDRNCRFTEEDLNRAFEFVSQDKKTYENGRARELKIIIESEPCLILDLHTTTSNMGSTVIVSHYNSLNLSLCAKLLAQFPDCRIIGAPDPSKKYLASQSEFGLILEVGPVANGVVGAAALESTIDLIESILQELTSSNRAQKGSLDVYEELEDIYYPQNEKGELTGYIHSGFQGQDFKEIEGDYIPFMSFKKEAIKMKTAEKLYPIFINEAAYYPKKMAFTLCRKLKMNY